VSDRRTYTGVGVLVDFVAAWGKASSAVDDSDVIHEEYLGNPAVTKMEQRKFVIDFGG